MDDIIYKELFDTVCGEELGRGMSRVVYECEINPKLVIKIEQPGRFQNVREFSNWEDFEFEDEVNQWLAPCYWLSPNGRILVQEKCEPVTRSELPDKIPKFITDSRVDNFGKLNGKLVCLDYSFMITNAELVKKKIEWI